MVLNLKPMNGFQEDIVTPQGKKMSVKAYDTYIGLRRKFRAFFLMSKGVCDSKELKTSAEQSGRRLGELVYVVAKFKGKINIQ